MSTVIKSGTSTPTVQRIAFNLQDITRDADQYLEQVRLKAAQIVVEAQKQAETVRRRAEVEGRDTAMRTAQQVLEQRVGKEIETLTPALKQVIGELRDARQTWLQYWEKTAVHLSCKIAERITRRMLAASPEITVELIREALDMAAGSPRVEIHLNPANVKSLGDQLDRLIREFDGLATATIIADESVSPGGCRVQLQHGAIDQQFASQLARIEAELTAGNDE
jgi:flagellar assembly protein FliH